MSRPIPQPSQGDNSPCTHAYCIPTDTRHPRTVEGAVSSQLYPSTSSIASPYTSNGFKILHKTATSCRQCRDLPLRKPNAQLPGEIPARSSQANAAVKAHRPQPLTRNSTEVLMTPEESKVFVARSLTRELSQASGLGTQSAALSFVPPNFAKGMALKPYQCADVKRILSRESGEVVDGFKTNTGFIIGYEMGLGKTPLAIAVICHSLAKARPSDPLPTLVLCPGPGVMSNWVTEIDKFAPSLKPLRYHGPKRLTDLDKLKSQDIILATYHQVAAQHQRYLADKEENEHRPEQYPFYAMEFRRVVLDEAHVIRNPETQSAAACWALRKTHGLCLTGTPAQNSARDFASYFTFLGVKIDDLGCLGVFDDTIMRPINEGNPFTATQILTNTLRKFMIHRTGELIDLPPRQDELKTIQLTDSERAVYCYVSKMNLCSYAMGTRLRQVASHPLHVTMAINPTEMPAQSQPRDEAFGDHSANRVVIKQGHGDAIIELGDDDFPSLPDALRFASDVFKPSYRSSKITTTVKILQAIKERRGNEKTIVFAYFKLTLELLQSLLEENGIGCVFYNGDMGPTQRDVALVKLRDDPKCTVILMSIMAGSVGINVTSCNNVVLMEPWWNPYVEDQAIGRAHRLGQKRPVHVYKLVVKNTIEDQLIVTSQEKKKEIIGQILGNMTTQLSSRQLKRVTTGVDVETA